MEISWKQRALAALTLASGLLAGILNPALAVGVEDPGGAPAPHSPGGVPSNGTGPAYRTWPIAAATSRVTPGLNPQGANDFSCRPREGERPVVLVPGTKEDAFATWSFYAPSLRRDGWCVFTFNYNPSYDLAGNLEESNAFAGDIRSSAAFLAGFVDKVLDATGAQQVDLVGHSQGGGPLPRAYLKWFGGAERVNHLVGIVPSNKGTTVFGLQELLEKTGTATQGSLSSFAAEHNMQALPQQLQRSPFLTELNAGGMSQAGVRYTVIATKLDDVVTPYTNSFIPEPGVTNLTIQSLCPADLTDHFGATYDPVGYQVVRNALDPSRAQKVNCTLIPPVIQ